MAVRIKPGNAFFPSYLLVPRFYLGMPLKWLCHLVLGGRASSAAFQSRALERGDGTDLRMQDLRLLEEVADLSAAFQS
jgi:hypothetical protein